MASPIRWGTAHSRPYRSSFAPAQWTIENFKAIEHATLPLSRLVTLTGANSSGKSSMIQSLLLLAQSTGNEIILNGPLVRLGDSSDVIRSGCDDVSVGYSAWQRTSGEGPAQEWSFDTKLIADQWTLRAKEFYAALDGAPLLTATNARVTKATSESIKKSVPSADAILHIKEIRGAKARAHTYLSLKGLYPSALIFRRKPEQVEKQLRKKFSVKRFRENPELSFELFEVLQDWRRTRADRRPNEIDAVVDTLFDRGSPTRLVFETSQVELNALFHQVALEVGSDDEWVAVPISPYNSITYRGQLRESTILGLDDETMQALATLGAATESLRSIQDSIRYLGPLREEPQVVSVTGGRNPTSPAGSKGEYTADLLARGKRQPVRVFDWTQKRLVMPLPEAVSLWTTYLGVGDAVAVEDQGKLGRGLRLNVNGVERDLTTIGVGASQVLPVLAVVLAADSGAIVCLEQPELHLHPAVQSRLADFFLFARPDIKLVVETHSEYLITRMRRRVAEGASSTSDVTILFAEQSDGVSTLRTLQMDSAGDLSDWPAGFFDSQEEDARALVSAISARSRKRRQ